MRCLVTGASGFLGSYLVKCLLERGHSVSVLLRPEANESRLSGNLPYLRVLRGSLSDLSELRNALQSKPVDVAFHLAWAGISARQRNYAKLSIENVVGSLRLWEILAETGCSYLIGAGSQAEYGPYEKPLTEDLTAAPRCAYGASKLALGILLNQYCASMGMRFAWMRVLSLYGTGDNEKHMIPYLISSLLHGERPRLTAGKQTWDYLHVEDAASAFCAVMENNATGTFNLGSGHSVRISELASTIRDAINPELELGLGEIPYGHDQIMYLLADTSRLKNATGWSPNIDMAEGLRRTIDDARSRLTCADCL